MLNEITSSIYRRLREKAGLSKNELAPLLGCSRYKITKFENGSSHPTAEQMQKLMELAGCTQEDVAKMTCKRLGKKIARPVGFLPRNGESGPKTPLAKAKTLINEYAHGLSASLLQALNHKIKTIQFMSMAMEGHNTEMEMLVDLCMDRINRDRGSAQPKAS